MADVHVSNDGSAFNTIGQVAMKNKVRNYKFTGWSGFDERTQQAQ